MICAFSHSLYCMDTCSVYSITSGKWKLVLTACAQSSEPPTKKTVIFVMSCISSFLWNATCRQERYIHQWHLQTMLRGQDTDPSLLRVQSDGERGGGTKGMYESCFRPSHWQSRRNGGNGVSSHCQRTPYCHLEMRRKKTEIYIFTQCYILVAVVLQKRAHCSQGSEQDFIYSVLKS